LRNGQDNELSDPLARLGDERPLAVGVQEYDHDLAAVARVDQARRVDDRDPVPGREARPRLDEACIPLRDRNREPCADERVLAEPLDLELDHRPRARAAGSATRYGAKRGTSR